MRLLLSCEHGGNRVPDEYAQWFAGHDALLASHRGWDEGALELAELLRQRLGCPLHSTNVTRLLVDTNRSEGHPKLLSELSRGMPAELRERAVREHWMAHRQRIEAAIEQSALPVLHFGVHSFTPVLDGKVRDTDLGLLYDPGRPRERNACAALSIQLRALLPGWRIHKNRPYRGVSDGLTRGLRQRFDDAKYAGVELELNQGRLGQLTAVADALGEALG